MASASQPAAYNIYTYTPSSSASTRQIIDQHPTPPSPSSTSTPTPEAAARRPLVTRQKSTNYAEADAARRATAQSYISPITIDTGAEAQDRGVGGGREEQGEEAVTPGGAAVGWRPKVNRMQSWNQQDLKHKMQTSMVEATSPAEGVGCPGFSEVGRTT
jgi:hypothetical protein